MTDQFFGLTDTGKERKNNEDTFIAQQSDNGKFIIAGVIDGVGGYAGGEVAASLAREAILQRLSKSSGEIIPMMIDCFNLANEKILAEKKKVPGHDSMACVATFALVDIEHNQFYYAHVGDTRLYLLRDHSLVKISHDQSFVGFLEDSGRITEEAAMSHPNRNEINKALGFEVSLANDYIETGQSPFLPGDLLLLCSDGLTDMVGTAEITEILTKSISLKNKCHELVNAANKHGGRDNITVVLAQNNRQPSKHDATMPSAGSKKNTPADEMTGAEQQTDDEPALEQPVTTAKSRTGLITVLTILMLIFLGTSIWQYLQNNQSLNPTPKQADSSVIKPRNKLETKLQNSIDQAKGHVVILADTAYPSPIIITAAIQINKDSLIIKAGGKIELQADSSYKGAAFSLSATCKNVVIDSLVINNFQTGVSAFNNALSLKNTRFINCVTPLQNGFILPGKKYVNGKIPAPIFRIDSLPLTGK